MEIPISTSLCAVRCPSNSICQSPRKYTFTVRECRHRTKKTSTITTMGCRRSRRRRGRGELRVVAENSSLEDCSGSNGAVWEQPGAVEVIGVGSRVDSVLDYCLSSSSSSVSLRFWNIIMRDSQRWRLQRRFLGKDKNPDDMEDPLTSQSCHKAVILVASAGYDNGYIAAVDILKRIRSANGLVIAIILRPFDFEGRRRQEEVRTLLQEIQEWINFYIEIDINNLLKMDFVTLDEALRTTNRAVLLGIRAACALGSETHIKHIDLPHDGMKEVNAPRVIKVLEGYKEANIGFGVGANFKASILQAAFHCPFLPLRLKDLDGLVICILSSRNVGDHEAKAALLHTFRKITDCKQDVMISVAYDPDLPPNVTSTTIITMSSTERKLVKKSGFLSKLAEQLPFVFNLLWKSPSELDNPPPSNHEAESLSLPAKANPPKNKALNMLDVATPVEDIEMHSSEHQMFLPDDSSDHAFREHGNEANEEENEVEYSDFSTNTSGYYEQNVSETTPFQRETLLSWDIGMVSKTGHEVTKDGNIAGRASPQAEKPSILLLPVGVRPTNEENSSNLPKGRMDLPSKTSDHTIADMLAIPSGSSWNKRTDASGGLNGKYADGYKQGVLSARAASMLDAERDSEKKWIRTLEIEYRGGTYKGHCQGGLPEGRGCLRFLDGSSYDGMWRNGKRSGLGTFYFSNGDVFQGTWRDDLMHGKGWLYFHSGDRWFSNFWKGQANGEGRFYSKSGEVFYGHFKDGWRHGRFQCVKNDGTRFVEIWEDGVLLQREHLDGAASSSSDDDQSKVY